MNDAAKLTKQPSAHARASALWRARNSVDGVTAIAREGMSIEELERRLAAVADDETALDDEAAAVTFLGTLVSCVMHNSGQGATPSRILVQNAAALAMHWFPNSAVLELLSLPLPPRRARLSIVPTDKPAA
jgi:hypothetical protein